MINFIWNILFYIIHIFRDIWMVPDKLETLYMVKKKWGIFWMIKDCHLMNVYDEQSVWLFDHIIFILRKIRYIKLITEWKEWILSFEEKWIQRIDKYLIYKWKSNKYKSYKIHKWNMKQKKNYIISLKL